MTEDAPFLPGLSPVAGKPVHVAFDGGRMSSDAGVLLLAEIERKLGLADRLARCIEDPRAPERVRHGLGLPLGRRLPSGARQALLLSTEPSPSTALQRNEPTQRHRAASTLVPTP
jgi:hypothetical protein